MLKSPLKLPNFRWLWFGQTFIFCGAQFWFVALMGIGGGIVGVLGLTWLQQETAISMQGRMMSLVMFAAVALAPFSQAISGVLLEINLTGLFVAAGITMLVTALVSLLSQVSDRYK
jgi:DNA-directed RNA polymerase subunit E'/Rpb7